MISIIKKRKYIFIDNNTEQKYINLTLLKSDLINFFKFLLFLNLIIFFILAKLNKLTNKKISRKNKIVQTKKKISRNDPNFIKKKYKEFIMELPSYNRTHMKSKKISIRFSIIHFFC